jgi:hypothetical protein
MTVARDIAMARGLLEKAERAIDPEVKVNALDEALALLASCDADEVTDGERTLIANLRLSHTRRLLTQLVTPSAISMDAWFDYANLLFGELSSEVAQLVASDPQLQENYERFISLLGTDVANILKPQSGVNP